MQTKFNRVRIYVGLRDQDGKLSNLEMVPYKAVFERYIRERLADLFQAATIIDSVGFWEGKQEPSKVIEILRDEDDGNGLIFKDKVNTLAEELKARLNQDCVLVTSEDIVVGTFI